MIVQQARDEYRNDPRPTSKYAGTIRPATAASSSEIRNTEAVVVCGPAAVPLSSTYSCIAAELFRSLMVGMDNQ